MKFIVGLGNPGEKYKLTRHNVGFMAVDAYLYQLDGRLPTYKNEKKALVYKLKHKDQDVLFALPQTFMNLSGESVGELLRYYNIPLEDMLVLHDDIDLKFGVIKFQKARGPGGHNGIRNIHQMLGTNDYARLKIGVDRPLHPGTDHVLGPFTKEQQVYLGDLFGLIIEAIDCFIENDFLKCATSFNSRQIEVPI